MLPRMHTTLLYQYAMPVESMEHLYSYSISTNPITRNVQMFNLYEPHSDMWFSFCINYVEGIVRVDKIRGLEATNPDVLATWYMTIDNARKAWRALRQECRNAGTSREVRWLNEQEMSEFYIYGDKCYGERNKRAIKTLF